MNTSSRHRSAGGKGFTILEQHIGILELDFTGSQGLHFPPFQCDARFKTIMQVIVELRALVQGDGV